MSELFPFPPQPSDVAWPTQEWIIGDLSPSVKDGEISSALGELFDHGVNPPVGKGISLATVIIHRGKLVLERYGTQPDTAFGAGGPVDRDTTLISWSMAKSITQTVLAILLDEMGIDVDSPVAIPEWSGDQRSTITWRHLLEMRDGLDFVEEYVVDESGQSKSDVLDMLFGSGSSDVAQYARSRPLKHEPGSVWSYSSGSTNILCGLIKDLLGTTNLEDFLDQRIFTPLGMLSATAKFDEAGTFIGSSYVYATARDFGRFGYLYLRGGECESGQLLSRDRVDAARWQHAVDIESGHGYGQHWWIWKSLAGAMSAQGYEGQRTIVVPQYDLVVVHLGKWVAETQPYLDAQLDRVVGAFAD